MEYISTRGSASALDFEGVTLAGLASDGGLYLPTEWPRFSEAQIADMVGLPYAELATRVMWPFVEGSLTEEELRSLCQQAYGRFAHKAVTPLVQLDERQWLLELFHGPTLAFQDVALQLLGLLFETFLSRRQSNLTIIGATSGDTGSAAIDAVAGREGVDIFMLHPKGRVSDVQRRQMTTARAPNVHNIAIEGSFDDAQAMVKRMFGDADMTGRFNIGAVNSINWARLMAQVVYYFASALQLGALHRPVAYSVPTGNFGDVFAGYVAAQMGLPIAQLVVATNVNDILHRALSDGDYSTGTVTPTDTPSMDIQVSSNFERAVYYAYGEDGGAVAQLMDELKGQGGFKISQGALERLRGLFAPGRCSEEETLAMITRANAEMGELLCPHSAVGVHVAQDHLGSTPMITLATAHPAKFPDAVERASGIRPGLPARMADLFDRPERVTRVENDLAQLEALVRAERAA